MTKIPEKLQQGIEALIEQANLHELAVAREDLTNRYKKPPTKQPFMETDLQRHAYLAARLPATYAALCAALHAINKESPEELSIKSLLDLGAGPGTGMWAACEFFSEIESITLLEKDLSLSLLGRQLARSSETAAIRSADWQVTDLAKPLALQEHDLVILSYSIGEIEICRQKELIDEAWNAAKKLLLIVEPGTPAGFERVRYIRDQLIEKGAAIIAPCTHCHVCPMAKGDWCHFFARVERSFIHKHLKGGSLGYEDEKFSYIAFSKIPIPEQGARVISHPKRHCGHVQLKLCAPEGIKEETFSKKMGTVYRKARKADWGEKLIT